MKDLVTIIVPVYNVEKYLDKCISTLCTQTYSNIQIILIDDGSTDESKKICKAWQLKDKRIMVLCEENKGQGSARNLGLNSAEGKYIVFVDSDDTVSNNYIETLYNLLIFNDADISCCNCDQYDEKGNYYGKYWKNDGIRKLTGTEAIFSMWYQGIINIGPWGKMYRADLWKNVRFVERFGEDYATMHYIYEQASKVIYTYTPLYHYLIRMNSDIHSFNPKEFQMLNTVQDTLKYASKNSALYKAALHKGIKVNFHILFQMPNDDKYILEKKQIKRFIKKNRKAVFGDRRCDKKTRLAIILSFLGFKVEKNILKFIKEKHKEM